MTTCLDPIALPTRPMPALSDREIEVLRWWVLCDTKEDVGRHLFISEATVNTHISRIRAKYDAVGRPGSTKATLLARALQDGIVHIDEL